MQNDTSKLHEKTGSKPLGRPTHNPGYVLTRDQIAFIVAILLTDGCSFNKCRRSLNKFLTFSNLHFFFFNELNISFSLKG